MKAGRSLHNKMTVIGTVLTILVILLPLLFFQQLSFGQAQEFGLKSNGLIYSEETIGKLRYIVDSLNLKFRTCELQKTYLSKPQARTHYIILKGNTVKQAKKDIMEGVTLETFLRRYPDATVEEDLLLVKHAYTNYNGKEMIEYSTLSFDGHRDHSISFEADAQPKEHLINGQWIVHDQPEISKSDKALGAFYLVEGLQAQPLPLSYARIVQYSDCMVDTTSLIFHEKARTNRYILSDRPEAIERFLTYVHKETGMPKPGKKVSEDYWEMYQTWNMNKIAAIKSKLLHKDKFKTLLEEAAKAALTEGGSDEELEEYIGEFYSKKVALELKRSRQVIGNCSMDDSPRMHALNIALLSAETAHWETFLRAHLDIMNDRFERVSDGSYAWARRQTYIQELEVIDINVPNLLFGITLRISNPSENHYFGDISRLGRALSETKQAEEIRNAMLAMIADPQLDSYNRVLIYYLFRNYNHYLEDKTKQQENIYLLNEAVKTLPAFLAAKALVKE